VLNFIVATTCAKMLAQFWIACAVFERLHFERLHIDYGVGLFTSSAMGSAQAFHANQNFFVDRSNSMEPVIYSRFM